MNRDKTPPVNANMKRRNTRIWAIGPLKSLPYIFKKGGRGEGEERTIIGARVFLFSFSLEP
jgi:hypothetical protein